MIRDMVGPNHALPLAAAVPYAAFAFHAIAPLRCPLSPS